MFYTVYKITNLINEKMYIGVHKTTDLGDNYMGSGKYLLRAQQKYGIDNFKKEYIAIFDNSKEMFELEKQLANEEFVSRDDTYNLKEGGYGGFEYINKNNIKNYDKVSSSLRDYYIKNEHHSKGRIPSSEERELISNVLKEKYLKEDHHTKGKTYEEIMGVEKAKELRKLRSEQNSNRSEETRKKLSEALKGKKKSKEHCKKLSMLVWMNNGVKNKRSKPEEVDNWLLEGWELGKLLVECEYCGKKTDQANHKQWHGDNCKRKEE